MASSSRHFPPRVAKYTAPISNVKDINIKASLFKCMWPHIREKTCTDQEFEELARDFLPERRAIFKTEILHHTPRLLILRQLDKKLRSIPITGISADLLSCNEVDVLSALKELFIPAKKKTIRSKISTLRQAFRQIGRENAWHHNAPICQFEIQFASSGNPITEHVQKELLALASGGSVSASHGGSATLPLVNWYTTELLAKFITKSLGKNASGQTVKSIVNLGHLNALMMFLMHTGARPGNIVEKLKYADLVFYGMDKPACWLTLAFVKASTLAEIIEKDVIKLYGMNLYKGSLTKGGGEVLKWQKTTVPAPYNMLDLPYVLAITWRVIMMVCPEEVFSSERVFSHPAQTFSNKFKKLNNSYDIKDFVLYSMRYGSAKEDTKGRIVPEDVTSERMSHTEVSDIAKEVYANCNKVIVVDEKEIVATEPTSSSGVGLVWCPIRKKNAVYNQRFWSQSGLSQKAIDDFRGVNDLVMQVVLEKSESAKAALLALYADGDVDAGLDKLPLGMHYTYPANALPERLMDLHATARETLSGYFKSVEIPELVPELAYLPQIIYGNWRSLDADNAFDVRAGGIVKREAKNVVATAVAATIAKPLASVAQKKRKSTGKVAVVPSVVVTGIKKPKRVRNKKIVAAPVVEPVVPIAPPVKPKRVRSKKIVAATVLAPVTATVAAPVVEPVAAPVVEPVAAPIIDQVAPPVKPKRVRNKKIAVAPVVEPVVVAPVAAVTPLVKPKRVRNKKPVDVTPVVEPVLVETPPVKRSKKPRIDTPDLDGRFVYEKFDDRDEMFWGIVKRVDPGYLVYYSDGEIIVSTFDEVMEFVQPVGTVWPVGVEKPVVG